MSDSLHPGPAELHEHFAAVIVSAFGLGCTWQPTVVHRLHNAYVLCVPTGFPGLELHTSQLGPVRDQECPQTLCLRLAVAFLVHSGFSRSEKWRPKLGFGPPSAAVPAHSHLHDLCSHLLRVSCIFVPVEAGRSCPALYKAESSPAFPRENAQCTLPLSSTSTSFVTL